jgi:hypothetical protein
VRFENLARLAYHILSQSAPGRSASGRQTAFFEYLTARQRQEPYQPAPHCAWVVAELQPWLNRVRS